MLSPSERKQQSGHGTALETGLLFALPCMHVLVQSLAVLIVETLRVHHSTRTNMFQRADNIRHIVDALWNDKRTVYL